MKKYSILFLFMSLRCIAQDTSKLYLERAEIMYNNIRQHFSIAKYNGLFAEHFPSTGNDSLNYFQGNAVKEKEVSFLWPFSGVFSATNCLLKTPVNKQSYLHYINQCVTAVEYYRDTTRKPVGYQAYPRMLEKVDRYYDDNGLVGIDYMESFFNTQNPLYLARAKEVFSFIESGWNNDAGGGVTWLEGVNDQKPACSNGTGMLTALKIYEGSKEDLYLRWGKKFYDWEYKYLKDSNGLYCNNRNLDGTLNRTFYTYNSGFMLEAAVLLFRFTKEEKYLHQAKELAKNSFDFFTDHPHDKRLNFYIDLPWFVTVLFRGYEALYLVDSNRSYITAVEEDLNYAWEHTRDNYGYVSHNWLHEKADEIKPKWLLDQTCIAELYARLSRIYAMNK